MLSVSTDFAILVGAVLIVAGWWFLRRQRKPAEPRVEPEAGAAGEQSRDHKDDGQRRRRQKMAILLIVLGILLPGGRLAFENVEAADRLVRGVYWIGVLGLVFWMLALAVTDIVKVALGTRAQLDQIRADQAALERDLRQFRQSHPGDDPN